MARLQFQRVSSQGKAADARHDIRAVENVGQAAGDIQYRTAAGAQARLSGASATTQIIGWNGSAPVWTPLPTATQANTAGLFLLNSVTASGASIDSGSFASVASSYIAIIAVAKGIRTATAAHIAARTSSDGINYSATTDSYSYAISTFTATQTAAVFITATSDDHIPLTATTSASFRFTATYAGAHWSGEITLAGLNATTTDLFPHLQINSGYETQNDHAVWSGSARRKEAIAQGGLQFALPNGGSFIDGRVDFFGVRGP